MRRFLPLLVAAATFFTGTLLAQNTPIKNLAPTGDLTPLVTALESARLYPVFIIPMGNGYYDIELKGTLTNFAPNNSDIDMVYFWASAVDVQPSHPAWDPAPKVYFTLASSAEPRAWHLSNNSLTLYEQVGSTSNARINQLVVIPSKTSSSSTWMYKGNTSLVWSYVRITAVGPETDGNGHIVWNPIVPVDWRLAPLVLP